MRVMRSNGKMALVLAMWLCAVNVSNALFFYIYKGVTCLCACSQ